MQYYGLDWLGTIFVLSSTYLLSRKRKTGCLMGSIGCVIMSFVNYSANIMPFAVLNIILLVINVSGYLTWDKHHKSE